MIRKVAANRALLAQQAALTRYRSRGTLSGDEPTVYEPEDYIRLDLTSGVEPPKKRAKRAAARERAAKRRRWHAAAAEDALRSRARRSGDVVGAYPMERILDVRLAAGRARLVEVLVRWEGEQWVGHDSWEPLANLTHDMRQQAELEAARRFPPGPPVSRTVSRASRRAAVRAALLGRRLFRMSGESTRGTRVAHEEGEGELGGSRPTRATRVLDEDRPRNARRGFARRAIRRIAEEHDDSEAEDMDMT